MELSRPTTEPHEQTEDKAHVPTWAKIAATGAAGTAFALAVPYDTIMSPSTVPYEGPPASVDIGTPVYDGPNVTRECGEVAASFTATPERRTDSSTINDNFYTFTEGLTVTNTNALDCHTPMIFEPDLDFDGE